MTERHAPKVSHHSCKIDRFTVSNSILYSVQCTWCKVQYVLCMYYQRTPEQIKKKLKTKQRYHGQKEQWKALMF